MVLLFRVKFILLLFFVFQFAEAKSESDWKYTRFPLIKPGGKVALPQAVNLNGESLKPLLHPESGTHLKIGVDQIYTSLNSKRKIFVKQDVEISNHKYLNQWITIAGGAVYHFKKESKLIAVFAIGYNERSLNQIEKQFNSTRFRKFSVLDLMISCAYAQSEVGFGDPMGVNPYHIEETYQVGSKGSPDEQQGLVSCILAKTGEGVWNVGAGAVDAVSKGASAVKGAASYAWSDPMGALSATGSYLYGAGESAVVGAWNGAVATYNYAGEVYNDPSKVWTDVTSAYDKTVLAAQTIYREVESAVAGFADLPPSVRTQLICEATAMAITEVGVSGVLALTGVGAGAAAVKAANFIRKVKSITGKMLPVLNEMAGSNLSAKDQKEIISGLFNESMTEAQAMTKIRGPNSPPSAGRAITEASPDVDAPASPSPGAPTVDAPASPSAGGPTPAAAAVKELTTQEIDSIEGKFADRKVQVKSLSGNTYEGEFVEIVRIDGVLTAVLKDKNGELTTLRASRLDFATMVEKGDGFTISTGGKLAGIKGTVVGDKIENFKTRTNLDIEIGKGGPMKSEFFIDGKGKVILHPDLAKNPARLDQLLGSDIVKVAIDDRRAKTNLTSVHGMTVLPDGTIKAPANPPTTFGKMVKGLEEKHGVRVTYHEGVLDELGAGGLSFTGQNRISISRDFLQSGKEPELLGLLRHEVKHSTTDRGATKHPTASIWEDNVRSGAAAHYSGENIRFLPGGPNAGALMEKSGVHKVYADGFRADEYSARLTQNPKRSGPAPVENARNYSQAWWIKELHETKPAPVGMRKGYDGTGAIVRYEVKAPSGDSMFIDIPLTGEVRDRAHAEAISREVIEHRLKYLRGTFKP